MNYGYVRSKYAIPEMSYPWFFWIDPKIAKAYQETPETIEKWLGLPVMQDFNDLIVFRDEQAKRDYQILRDAEEAEWNEENARLKAEPIGKIDLSLVEGIEEPTGEHDLSLWAGPRRWMKFDGLEYTSCPHLKDTDTYFVPEVPLRVVYPEYPYGKYTGYVMSYYMSEKEVRCVLTTHAQ